MSNHPFFEYQLPDSLIAQAPASPRDHSKLLVLNRDSKQILDRHFYDVPNFLSADDVLVFNNTQVMPARLPAKRKTGGKVEVLLLGPVPEKGELIWEALLRPAKAIKDSEILDIAEQTECTVLSRCSDTSFHLQFPDGTDVYQLMSELGSLPIPPYISSTLQDPAQYQSIFAEHEGSVAAPTASLHFSDSVLNALREKAVGMEYVTLHIGYGTFQPIRSQDLSQHQMHSERYFIHPETAETLAKVKAEGKRIVAVGTTVARTLESAYIPETKSYKTGWQNTDLFIYPGYRFQSVDALISNFHLPRSSLLYLVSAFASENDMATAYEHAMQSSYRFYSFGDAMLIL